MEFHVNYLVKQKNRYPMIFDVESNAIIRFTQFRIDSEI